MIGFIALADPYGEFGLVNTRIKSFSASPLSTQSFADRLRHGRYALIFGTSRSSLISSRHFHGEALNFHALYGHPRSVSEFLRSLGPQQIENITEIFYLLDLHAYAEENYTPQVMYGKFWSRTLYRLRRIGTYLGDSANKIWKNFTGRYQMYVNMNGSTTFSTPKNQCNLPVRIDRNWVAEIDEKSRVALSQIRSFGEKNEKSVHFATPALYRPFLDILDKKKLDAQKQVYRDVLGGFHDFLVYDHPLDACENFKDPSHLNEKGTDEYVRLIKSKALHSPSQNQISY